MPVRFVVGTAAALLLGSGLGAQEPAAKPAGGPLQVLEKVLGSRPAPAPPQPAVTAFTLGGFTVARVEAAPGAQPSAFHGSGWLELPPPLAGTAVTFQGLVLTGTIATGTITADLPQGWSAPYQGWKWAARRVQVSDQGSHLLGSLSAGRLQVVVDTATFTPAGLSGALALGDVPLAEGPFTADLEQAQILFSGNPPVLKGSLHVVLAPPCHDADSGLPVDLTVPAAFAGAALTTGVVSDAVATGLGVEGQGLVFRFGQLALANSEGVPQLRGSARLGFPLQTFCQAADTGQPYLAQAGTALFKGTAPAAVAVRPGPGLPVRELARPLQGRTAPAAGLSGSFPLGPATLLPSGLTTYHLVLAGGEAVVVDGALDPGATRVSGQLLWGPGWASEADFQDAPADLAQGLYLSQATLKGEVPVGAYGVQTSLAVVCDFSGSRSPAGLAAAWKGVYLPAFLLAMPEEIFQFDPSWNRLTTFVQARGGAFEADAGFSARVAVALADPVYLQCLPVKLDPFELEFDQGALLGMPEVTGTTDLDQPPLLPAFDLPLTFDLTQNGARKILLQTHTKAGDTTLKTDLVGIDLVLSGATLNPTNLDLAGRFDFHLQGAALPSIPFDHLVLEATGGGLEGKKGPVVFGMVGSVWAGVHGQPDISLWGFDFGQQEDGYGSLADGRFFVGVGGGITINPLVSSLYNRFLFTSEPSDPSKGTVETEKPFTLDHRLADLGSIQGSLGFTVATANDQVSDAYFLGNGKLSLTFSDSPLYLEAGMRFGQSYSKPKPFPYFYLLGEATFPAAGIDIAPDVEIYGIAGGMAQNFMPDQIQNTQTITGKEDDSLGTAIMAGVDIGTSDEFTFHGSLDLYVAQNLTVLLQGQGFLLAGREDSPPDRTVSADIDFTRNPDAFHAVLQADLGFPSDIIENKGEVELRFDPANHFVHIGTPDSPLTTSFLKGFSQGTSYFDADLGGGKATFRAGGGFSMDTGDRDFGPVFGRLYVDVRGDLVVSIDANLNPAFQGVLAAQGGADFGMSFSTFWQTYRLTIFSGSLSANLAMQVPGSPTLDGHVDISYSVLGGMFSGSAGVDMEF